MSASAQTIEVKGGLNLANIHEKDNDKTYSDDNLIKPGFHLGAMAEFPITDLLSFSPGLLLSTKGARAEDEMFGASLKMSVITYNFDIPLTMKVGYEINDGLKIFGAAGPYIGLGLSGKAKVTADYNGDKDTEEIDIEWGNDDSDDFKRLDMGLSFGGGVEINELVLGISYDLGLGNISPYSENGHKITNRVIKISVGYKFEL